MLSVSEAIQQVKDAVVGVTAQTRDLQECWGLTLATSIIGDIDSPPFDKALMDGYAIRSADLNGGTREFEVLEEVTAGAMPQKAVAAGQATRIMTGAPIPVGVDAVIKVEDTELISADGTRQRVHIRAAGARSEQNVLRRGATFRAGSQVLPAGRTLRAQELAALAEMGASRISVARIPEVAVLATGDELVGISEPLGPGQIRNSNETMLVAQIREAGAIPRPLGIARDERSHLRERILRGLESDFLLLSGGVSAGVLDLVPSELANAGVEKVFHQVNVKPGKPLWFGILRRPERPCLVFGLPGNPVSSMVCFELFVRTALLRFMGIEPAEPTRTKAKLLHAHRHKDDRETYFPAALDVSGGEQTVRLMNWHGSSDLQSTVDANGMAVFPALPRDYSEHETIDVIRWGK